jgi:hypothetical protein
VVGGVVGWVTLGRHAFGSVGVCDEACRLNGSGYESTILNRLALCADGMTILPSVVRSSTSRIPRMSTNSRRLVEDCKTGASPFRGKSKIGQRDRF